MNRRNSVSPVGRHPSFIRTMGHPRIFDLSHDCRPPRRGGSGIDSRLGASILGYPRIDDRSYDHRPSSSGGSGVEAHRGGSMLGYPRIDDRSYDHRPSGSGGSGVDAHRGRSVDVHGFAGGSGSAFPSYPHGATHNFYPANDTAPGSATLPDARSGRQSFASRQSIYDDMSVYGGRGRDSVFVSDDYGDRLGLRSAVLPEATHFLPQFESSPSERYGGRHDSDVRRHGSAFLPHARYSLPSSATHFSEVDGRSNSFQQRGICQTMLHDEFPDHRSGLYGTSGYADARQVFTRNNLPSFAGPPSDVDRRHPSNIHLSYDYDGRKPSSVVMQDDTNLVSSFASAPSNHYGAYVINNQRAGSAITPDAFPNRRTEVVGSGPGRSTPTSRNALPSHHPRNDSCSDYNDRAQPTSVVLSDDRGASSSITTEAFASRPSDVDDSSDFDGGGHGFATTRGAVASGSSKYFGSSGFDAGTQHVAFKPDACKRHLTEFLPYDTVRTEKQRLDFCSALLGAGGSARYAHLLDRSINNLGFVYEEGNDDFRKSDNKGQLTNLGILSTQRWKQGILAIHFLFPNKKQASNTRTARGPHGQATFVEFVHAMHEY